MITKAQAHVLRRISKHGSAYAGERGSAMSAITRTVERLQERGLVENWSTITNVGERALEAYDNPPPRTIAQLWRAK